MTDRRADLDLRHVTKRVEVVRRRLIEYHLVGVYALISISIRIRISISISTSISTTMICTV